MSRGRRGRRQRSGRQVKSPSVLPPPAAGGRVASRFLSSLTGSPRRLAIAVAVTVGVLVLAGVGGNRLLSPSRAALADLPDPDLGRVEERVAQKIRALRREVERNPRSAVGWGRLGMNFHIHQLSAEAIRAYDQAAALDPDDFRWPYFGAVVRQTTGFADAILWFERSRALRPDYAPLLVRLGRALSDGNRLDDAGRAFRSALAVDARSSHAHLGLARIALAHGDLATTENHLLRALEINPRHGEVHGLLAEVYRRRNQPLEADREVRRARQFEKATPLPDPVFVEVMGQGASSWWYLERGRTYMRAGLLDAAAREFRNALQARPDAETHYHLGLALQYGGDFDGAAEHHRAALTLRPRYREALHNLGTVLFEMGRVREAIEHVERAKQLDPAVPDAYLRLGILHERCGNYPKAMDEYRQGLARGSYDDRIATRLAWLLATSPRPELRDGDEAVRLATAAAELTVYGDLETLDVLAAAYGELGRFDEAIETARRASRLASSARRMDLVRQIQGRLKSYDAGIPLGRASDPAARLRVETLTEQRSGGC